MSSINTYKRWAVTVSFFAKKHWAVGLVLSALMASCGAPNETSSRLRDDSGTATSPRITAALSEDNDGKALLFVALPAGYEKVSYCVWQSGKECQEKAIELRSKGPMEGRQVYESVEPVDLSDKALWLITATKSDGEEISQKIRVSAKSAASPDGSLTWKVLLMASDQGNQGAWINAFDNARKKLKALFTGNGVQSSNLRELSLHPNQQGGGVRPTTLANFSESLKSLNATGPTDACLVHMTSHGSRDGFNFGSNRLSPSQLETALVAGCGNRPTVLLISACYSGLYVLDSSKLKKPNRIILTAARSDVTSFGCSPENEYTYWDGCLISSLPKSKKWKDLAADIQTCIVAKEGGRTASFPQAFIGEQVNDLALPGH